MPQQVKIVPHGTHGLVDLLTGADALITRDSTAVFEGNLLGVPVLTINLTGNDDRVPFAAQGGARGVYAFDDILPALRETLETGAAVPPEARVRFVARHLGPQDGRAAERIAGAIAHHAASRGPCAADTDCP